MKKNTLQGKKEYKINITYRLENLSQNREQGNWYLLKEKSVGQTKQSIIPKWN